MGKASEKSVLKRYIIPIIAAAFIVFSFTADFRDIIPELRPDVTGAAEVIEKINSRFLFTFKDKEMIISLGVIVLSFLFIKYRERIIGLEKVRYEQPAAIILAVLFIVGKCYLLDINILSSRFETVKCVAGGFGFYLFYLLIIRTFYYLMNFIDKKKSLCFLRSHAFLFTFILLMICWLPHLIIKYPAGIGWDASWQLSQGLGDTVVTTHHPVFHTMLMTWATKLGMLMGSANIGIFTFVLVQTIIGALIVAYIVKELLRIGSNMWTVIFTMIFFAFNPYVTLYVGQTIKDVLYTQFFMLFVFLICLYLFDKERLWTKRKTALFILSAIMTGTMRNNGIYVVAVTCAVLFVRELVLRKKKFYKRLIVFALCVFLPFLVTTSFNSVCNARSGSIAESLSVPIQQTARYAKYYNDATREERDAINRVLPYDKIGDLYDPYISDPVKGEYNENAGKEELKGYLKAWWSQGLRHPRCYVDATLQQNILMFEPEYLNKGYYVSVTENLYEWDDQYFSSPEWVKEAEPTYRDIMDTLYMAPVLYLFNNNVIYIIAGLLTFLCFCTKRIKGRHFIYVPLFVSFLVILAGPCSSYHVRYTFPIVYLVPVLIAVYTAVNRKLSSETNRVSAQDVAGEKIKERPSDI